MYTWLYPLKNKSQVAQIFPIFNAPVENRFKINITTLYSDNDGEFIALKYFLSAHGISHLTSPPHTPEHNGMTERRHRYIVEAGLSLLTHACIPTLYWIYSFAVDVYLINRLTTPNLAHHSPFQLLFKVERNYKKLRTFGCLCYPWIKPYGHSKFSPKSTPCVFMGYSLSQSAYICLDVTASQVYISRYVEFVESVFPFSALATKSSFSSVDSNRSDFSSASLVPVFHWPLARNSTPCTDPSPAVGVSSSTTPETNHDVPTTEIELDSFASVPATETEPDSTASIPATVTKPDSTALIPATEIESDSTVSADSNPPAASALNAHLMTTRAKNNIRKTNPKYGLTAVLEKIERENHTQALKDEKWRKAMSHEYDAFVSNNTFDLVDRSLAKNIVGSKWGFRIKRLPSGFVDMYKAGLVVKGVPSMPWC